MVSYNHEDNALSNFSILKEKIVGEFHAWVKTWFWHFVRCCLRKKLRDVNKLCQYLHFMPSAVTLVWVHKEPPGVWHNNILTEIVFTHVQCGSVEHLQSVFIVSGTTGFFLPAFWKPGNLSGAHHHSLSQSHTHVWKCKEVIACFWFGWLLLCCCCCCFFWGGRGALWFISD